MSLGDERRLSIFTRIPGDKREACVGGGMSGIVWGWGCQGYHLAGDASTSSSAKLSLSLSSSPGKRLTNRDGDG